MARVVQGGRYCYKGTRVGVFRNRECTLDLVSLTDASHHVLVTSKPGGSAVPVEALVGGQKKSGFMRTIDFKRLKKMP